MSAVSAAWVKALSLDDDEGKGGKGMSKSFTEATSSDKQENASHGASAKVKGEKPE